MNTGISDGRRMEQGQNQDKGKITSRAGQSWVVLLVMANGLVLLAVPLMVWFIIYGYQKGGVSVPQKTDVAVSLQDVSSLFTNHLTVISLMLFLASLIVVALQVYFQKQDTKR